MEQAIETKTAREMAVPLIGRRDELRAFVMAFRGRQSRLILGPPGAGKTRLLREACVLALQPVVVSNRLVVLHQLLVDLAGQLGCRSRRFPDVKRATSQTLQFLILEELKQRPRCVVLEDARETDPRMYRFLQRAYYIPQCCLIVTATGRERLGHLHKLLWDPRETIVLEPLNRLDSELLFDEAARLAQLDLLNLEDFRNKALAAARGNPGQIVAMCRMAARPEYREGRRVKFAPLRIDMLSSFAL